MLLQADMTHPSLDAVAVRNLLTLSKVSTFQLEGFNPSVDSTLTSMEIPTMIMTARMIADVRYHFDCRLGVGESKHEL